MDGHRINGQKRLKVFLGRYLQGVQRLKRLENKLSILNDRITSVKTPTLSGMPRGGSPVTIADMIADKDDLIKRIDKLKKNNRKVKREITDKLDTLDNPFQAEILEAHYIDGLSFEQIGTNAGYTTRYIYQVYSDALSVLQ